MTKELVTIEFRYHDVVKNDIRFTNKTITVGVFDTFEDAIIAGNKALEILESKFSIHKFPQGNEATKERFSKNGGCFGTAKRLVTNMAYLKTPFEFYASIKTLKYDDLQQTISDVLEANKRYREFKALEND